MRIGIQLIDLRVLEYSDVLLWNYGFNSVLIQVLTIKSVFNVELHIFPEIN